MAGMTLNSAEQGYLAAQPRGRLATIAPDGSPQNKPVGFSWNAGLGTIDIYGFGMEQSQKFRNVAGDPRVAFVVDDAPGTGAAGTRFLEIRGLAETASGQATPEGGVSPADHPDPAPPGNQLEHRPRTSRPAGTRHQRRRRTAGRRVTGKPLRRAISTAAARRDQICPARSRACGSPDQRRTR
jgi:pyridoxamine 5'-phosphate oxidase family protein